jgi:hypothetical protein
MATSLTSGRSPTSEMGILIVFLLYSYCILARIHFIVMKEQRTRTSFSQGACLLEDVVIVGAGGITPRVLPAARGLHLSTFRLNVSAFCGTGCMSCQKRLK